MTLHSLYISYIVPGSALLPVTAGAICHKRIPRSLRMLAAYVGIAFIINVVGVALAMRHINNLPLLHVYTAFELVAVLLYYKHAFADRKLNNILKALMWGFPLLCVINFAFIQSPFTFNTYTRPLEALIIIVFSVFYLLRADGSKANTAGRWVASAFLIYFCSSVFQFTFSNVLSYHASKAVRTGLWDVHATLVMVMYIIFFIAILQHARTER